MRDLPLTAMERHSLGVVVSFENADGARFTTHRPGLVQEGVRSACDEALARCPSYLIVAISTPQTVYADIVGRELGPAKRPVMPEANIVGRTGVGHLLHPSLSHAGERWSR